MLRLAHFVIALFFIGSANLFASHLIGGYVRLKPVAGTSTTYDLIFTGWYKASNAVLTSGRFVIGDQAHLINTFTIESTVDVGNDLLKVEKLVRFTFPSPGLYKVAFEEDNRSATVNASAFEHFFVQTEILIDPFLGAVHTPEILNHPIFFGQSGVRYLSSPVINIRNLEKLRFANSIPKNGDAKELSIYRLPNNQQHYANNFQQGNQVQNGVPTYHINTYTGTIDWDAPPRIVEGNVDNSLFSFAFAINHYREVQGVNWLISTTVVDYLVSVSSDGNKPNVFFESPICLAPDQSFEFDVNAETMVQMNVLGQNPISMINNQLFENTSIQLLPGNAITFIQFKDLNESFNFHIELSTAGNTTHRFGLFVTPDCPNLPLTISQNPPKTGFYPNPANHKIFLPNASHVHSIQILDTSGRIIFYQKTDLTEGIDISSLQSGIYLLRIAYADHQLKTEKLIVTK